MDCEITFALWTVRLRCGKKLWKRMQRNIRSVNITENATSHSFNQEGIREVKSNTKVVIATRMDEEIVIATRMDEKGKKGKIHIIHTFIFSF